MEEPPDQSRKQELCNLIHCGTDFDHQWSTLINEFYDLDTQIVSSAFKLHKWKSDYKNNPK